MTKNKIIIIIPARLKSSRFPNKILVNICGIPMIEHVRRRALMSKNIDKVIVATPDKKIEDLIKKNNGLVIRTYKNHINGTSRVAEVCKKINSSHVVILQGDEPLIRPKEIDLFISKILNSRSNIFNCIGKIDDLELYDESVVKVKINRNSNIIDCFRNYYKNTKKKKNIYKLFGMIGFKKNTLLDLMKLKSSKNEINLKIEQMRIIDNKLTLKSFLIKGSGASVNYIKDLKIVNRELKNDKSQKKILNKIR